MCVREHSTLGSRSQSGPTAFYYPIVAQTVKNLPATQEI